MINCEKPLKGCGRTISKQANFWIVISKKQKQFIMKLLFICSFLQKINMPFYDFPKSQNHF